jgi:hypothetical protein
MKLIELFEGQKERNLVGFEMNDLVADPKKSWSGNFICKNLDLTSLEGAPKSIVDGGFSCAYNADLISLKHAPSRIATSFNCVSCMLTTLEGGPSIVGKSFYCGSNRLTNLIGSPKHLEDEFDCSSNNLTSLEGITPIFEQLICNDNHLTSLHNIHKQIESVNLMLFDKNDIKSHILGLLKIKNLTGVQISNRKVDAIINKYLPLGNIIECQSELIEAGFEEYAQL